MQADTRRMITNLPKEGSIARNPYTGMTEHVDWSLQVDIVAAIGADPLLR